MPRHQSTTGTVGTFLDIKPDDHIYPFMVKLIFKIDIILLILIVNVVIIIGFLRLGSAMVPLF